jgi:16S rRNA (cytosine967-C5)-methyltransferase
MRQAGRIAAAIEVIADISERHRPASEALRDWGRAHRFAGSGDRSTIGTLVYDVLRRKSSLAALSGADTPRALVLAALRHVWSLSIDDIASAVEDEHGPGVLSSKELTALASEQSPDWPDHVKGDYPSWLAPSFSRQFGDRAAEEGRALSLRAPIDLRVNTLKANRGKLLKALSKFGAIEGPLSPWCVRIAPPAPDQRSPHVEAEPSHGKGWFEVQDAGSQVAALLSAAKAGEQVADICAGAGGKTLALAAMMQNKGQIHAHDEDRHRLRPIFERLQRSGARNVQVIGSDEAERLTLLAGKLDCVFIDAPCSGSGAWRRNPDSKWRLTEKQLQQRLADQRSVLDEGAKLVRPGGRVVYVTCSVLPEENGGQVVSFLARTTGFTVRPYSEQWLAAIGTPAPDSADSESGNLLLTPARHATDGFFVSVMMRASG